MCDSRKILLKLWSMARMMTLGSRAINMINGASGSVKSKLTESRSCRTFDCSELSNPSIKITTRVWCLVNPSTQFTKSVNNSTSCLRACMNPSSFSPSWVATTEILFFCEKTSEYKIENSVGRWISTATPTIDADAISIPVMTDPPLVP